MKMPRELVPVSMPSLNAWRVPMCVDEDEYVVCVSQNKLRMFDAETLPDFIKASMSMIHAFPFEPQTVYQVGWSDPRMVMSEAAYHYAYMNKQDPRLNDIGWRVNENLYMLILNQQQLESMNG